MNGELEAPVGAAFRRREPYETGLAQKGLLKLGSIRVKIKSYPEEASPEGRGLLPLFSKGPRGDSSRALGSPSASFAPDEKTAAPGLIWRSSVLGWLRREVGWPSAAPGWRSGRVGWPSAAPGWRSREVG